ncbi:MAG: Ig-like domain-containing protein, partial [Rhodothermales bacterium]|nr:Ig-like domain-containing protein [Rhodothermales bacterium]
MRISVERIICTLSLVVFVSSCAVPVAPTGGPADSNPPQIEEISPERDATNVSTSLIEIRFSEYIDQASFQRALQITPEPVNPPQISWKKKLVRISLQDSLRANTTYIITLDTDLRDRNSVSIERPEIVAFSTGPEINRATLRGSVIDGLSGESQTGFEVHAYLMADSADFPTEIRKPDYRTQSSRDGTFEFSYLSESLYHVLAFRDLNKNKSLDTGEESGSSRTGQWDAVENDTTALSPTIATALSDTLAPAVRRASSISNRRTILSMSEGVDLDNNFDVAFIESSGVSSGPEWFYRVSEDAKQIGLLGDALSGTYDVLVTAADSAGNSDTSRTSIDISDTADTLTVSISGFFSDFATDSIDGSYRYLQSQTFGLTSNGLEPPSALGDVVTVTDGSDTLDIQFHSSDGRRLTMVTGESDPLPDSIVVSVDASRWSTSDSILTASFARVPANELGELSGYFYPPRSGSTVVLELSARSFDLPQELSSLSRTAP